MKQQEETMLLRDADVEPTDRVLEDILGKDIYKVYKALIDIITAKYKLAYEWRFYKDGNAWLCKVSNKKRLFFGFLFGKNSLRRVSILQKRPGLELMKFL